MNQNCFDGASDLIKLQCESIKSESAQISNSGFDVDEDLINQNCFDGTYEDLINRDRFDDASHPICHPLEPSGL